MTDKDKIAQLEEQIRDYKEYFRKLSIIAMPSRSGYHKRGAIQEVLAVVVEAESWEARKLYYAIPSEIRDKW